MIPMGIGRKPDAAHSFISLRLGVSIHDLRARGLEIKTVPIENRNISYWPIKAAKERRVKGENVPNLV